MPVELQCKQTETVGTLLCLSLYSEEVEEEVAQLITVTTTTEIGSSDTMWDNKEGFPALPFLSQLVQDNKKSKKAVQCVRLKPDRYWIFEADNYIDI